MRESSIVRKTAWPCGILWSTCSAPRCHRRSTAPARKGLTCSSRCGTGSPRCGKDLDPKVAERIAIEIVAEEAQYDFLRCARAIGRQRDEYHPAIAEVLAAHERGKGTVVRSGRGRRIVPRV